MQFNEVKVGYIFNYPRVDNTADYYLIHSKESDVIKCYVIRRSLITEAIVERDKWNSSMRIFNNLKRVSGSSEGERAIRSIINTIFDNTIDIRV